MPNGETQKEIEQKMALDAERREAQRAKDLSIINESLNESIEPDKEIPEMPDMDAPIEPEKGLSPMSGTGEPFEPRQAQRDLDTQKRRDKKAQKSPATGKPIEPGKSVPQMSGNGTPNEPGGKTPREPGTGEPIEPEKSGESSRIRQWRKQIQEAKKLSKIASQAPEIAKKMAFMVAQAATSTALKLSWENLLPSFGLTYFYIFFHFIMAYVVGSQAFCRFGEEWAPPNAPPGEKDFWKMFGLEIFEIISMVIVLMILVAIVVLPIILFVTILGDACNTATLGIAC